MGRECDKNYADEVVFIDNLVARYGATPRNLGDSGLLALQARFVTSKVSTP